MKNIFTLIFVLFLSTSLLAQNEKKVVIEHFTNTRCGICASRNPTFYQTLEDYPQVLHIAYHPSSPYASCAFSQHNPEENDERANFYTLYGGTPRIAIQGAALPAQNPLVGVEQIEAQLGQASNYRMTVANEMVSGSNYKVTMELERVEGADFETVLVYAGLAEKEVNYNAPNGESLHHDVFRKRVFYDTANVNPVGSKKVLEFEYSMNSAWNKDEIFAYVIIHDPVSQEVLQSASSLDSPTFLNNTRVKELNALVYPNPASNYLNIKPELQADLSRIEVYSLVGNKVKEFSDFSRMDISDLKEGLYLVMITDKNNTRYSSKMMKTNH